MLTEENRVLQEQLRVSVNFKIRMTTGCQAAWQDRCPCLGNNNSSFREAYILIGCTHTHSPTQITRFNVTKFYY